MNGWKRGFAGRMLIPDHPHTGSGPQDSAGCTRQSWWEGGEGTKQVAILRQEASSAKAEVLSPYQEGIYLVHKTAESVNSYN